MKKKIFNFILYSLLGALSFSALQVYATTQGGFVPWQGGTGIVGVTAGEVGNCLKVLANSPFRFELGSCGSGSGVWPFITTANNFNLATQSTSTPLWLRGSPFSLFASSTAVFVNASTTQLTVGSDFITDLSTGLTISAGGAVTVTDVTCTDCLTSTEIDSSVALSSLTLTVAGTANQITSSAGAQDLTANRTWTLSLPSHVIFPSSYVASQGTTTNATSTNITVTGNFIVEPLTSALVLTGSAGAFAEYAGASCTNQFPQVQSATGGWTCDSVVLTTDVSGDLPFANLAQVSANSVLANPTGATADAQSVATSTLFGASVPGGYVLASNGSTWQAMATATCAAITGSADLCDGSDATGAGGSGTVSTSTNETAGQLSYWTTNSGTPAKLGQVATSSLTANSPLSLSQPISVIGSAASALSLSTTGDWTGTIDGNNFAGGAIGVGELVYGGSAGSFSELAVSTNGFVLALSGGLPVWVASTTLANISGTLGVGSGGTGVTAFTANSLLYSNSAGTGLAFAATSTLNVGTATALAANGANCSAGSYPLGVDASGAVEDCTVASTGGGSDPFSHTTNFGQTVSATTTALWMQGSPFSFFASSTAVFVNASTTKLTLGSDFITDLSTGLTIDAAGAVTVTDVTCTNCLTATEVASADLATNVSDADFGDLTVSSGVWAVEDDSHAHTSTSLSGIDISADTNLTCGTNCTLTGDDISVDDAFILNTGDIGTGNYTFPYASTTALTVSNSAYFATSAGSVGVGTTTPQWPLSIFSATQSQLALSAGAGIAQWTMRNAGGNLYFSTTTVNGTATTTTPALSLIGAGKPGIGVSSSTPNATLTVEGRAGDYTNLVYFGSSTAHFLMTGGGKLFLPSLTADAAAHTYTMCGAATTFEAIWDTTTCVLSAKKYKENIEDLDIGLTELLKIRPVVFDWKPTGDKAYDNDINTRHRQAGIIADQVASSSDKMNEYFVTYDNKGEIKGFRYDFFTVLITKSVQTFYKEFQVLLARVSGLEDKFEKQQEQIDNLQKQVDDLKVR